MSKYRYIDLCIDELKDKKRQNKNKITPSEIQNFIISLNYDIEMSSLWGCIRYGLEY
jgi:hypothetical protein